MFEAKILSGIWEEETIILKGMPKDFVLSARNLIVLETKEHAKLQAENKRLKDIARIGCHCNRQELIQWLESNKVAADQPFEKERTIVLRIFVLAQALSDGEKK